MTATALVLAPLTCSVVLAVSGIAKARDTAGTREAFRALSVPEALRGEAVVRSLPYVEAGLALLLVVTWSWGLAAVGAVTTVLFAAYWVLVLLVLRRDEDVDCGCFGAVGSDRVTWATLARNSVLVVLGALATALGVAGSGVPRVLRDLSGDSAVWLLMALAVAAATALVVGRRSPEPTTPNEHDLLDYDRQAIPFALLTDAEGRQTTLRELARDRPQLLVFLSPSCSSCVDVANRLVGWRENLGPVEVQAVFTYALAELPANVTPPSVPTWFDVAEGATTTFAPTGRPAAVLLGADGQLAGGPVAGSFDVTTFVEDIVAELAAVDEAPGETEHGVLDGREHDHGHEFHGHGHSIENEHDHQH
ncbi:MAG: MauE/DoxX family redox-associated membrane protein [Nocardioides sp.]